MKFAMATTPPKKRKYFQSFNKAWLEDPDLKQWIVEESGDAAGCKVCQMSFKRAKKGDLLRHAESQNHKDQLALLRSSAKMTEFFAPRKDDGSKTHAAMVATAELQVAAFLSEHSLSLNSADHLVDLVKKVSKYPPAVVKAISLKRTKATYTIVEGMGRDDFHQTLGIIQAQKFSLLIDESTDVTQTQNLALVVRYLCHEKKMVRNKLLDIVEVQGGTSAALFEAVQAVFHDSQIPFENVIGFAADNCSTMMGEKSGFQARLKEVVPQVFVNGCVCHSLALCVIHACERLPQWLDKLVKKISSYFSHSGKRQREFKTIQEMLDVEEHRILKLAGTRWLSREQVCERILEQWEALKLFFQMEAPKDEKAAFIGNHMTDGTRALLAFVVYVTKKVNKCNLIFQSEDFTLHKVFPQMSELLCTLMSMFMKIPGVTQDPKLPQNFLPLEEIQLGTRGDVALASPSLSPQERTQIRRGCLNCLVELCSQIKRRIDFKTMEHLSCLDPVVAAKRSNRRSLQPLVVRFSHIIEETQLDDLGDEWRELPVVLASIEIDLANISAPEFWINVGQLKNGTNEPRFPILSSFCQQLLALPHSTAAVERIFSSVNAEKTKKRNRLTTSSVKGLLRARSLVSQGASGCVGWEPSNQLLKDVIAGGPSRRYKEALKKEGVTLEAANEDDVLV